MKTLLISILLVSCTSIKMKNSLTDTEQVNEAKIELVRKKLPIKTLKLLTGKVSYVDFDTSLSDGVYDLTCIDTKTKKDYKSKISVRASIGSAYFGENYFSKPATRSCYIEGQKVLNVEVSHFNYKKERLNVSKKHIDISAKNLARHKKEKVVRAKVYSTSAENYLFDEPFRVPLSSFITSHYGNQRIFNNKKKSQHLGNDMRAAVGVPIPVSNRGKVVFTGNWFFSGSLVVVDHGMNIFTNYMHLSKILVTKGTIVNKGDIIGLAGKTGRVSGPHLHWGAKINGNNVDGFSLVEESKKHFQIK